MKYTICVTEPEYWQEIHDLLCESSSCDHIPDRKVECVDEKEHSPTRGTFELDDDEAEQLKNHEKIKWIELSPKDYPDRYPSPQPATKRFKTDVKVYRDLSENAPVATGATVGELNRTNWAVKRVGILTNSQFWGISTGQIAPVFGDISYSLTGKNVDIVIQDSGVFQYHPEFIDLNGQSRVRDIILDGPYYIDPDYFITNNFTYVKSDGRIGITTASAEGWWENSSNRSLAFQSEGTVAISPNYTQDNSMGIGGTENNLTDGHGTSVASLAAGKNYGLAFESNIWNMPGISDNVNMSIEENYDAMKIWHRNKPINPETGKVNPTVVNGSWGYQAGFESGDTVSYKFRGATGSFIGNAAVTDQVTAMKEGLVATVSGTYSSWATSSRSNSIDTAADEMMAEGVIYVASAGNNNQRLGVGADDPDRLNYMEDVWYGSTDPRPEFPAGTVPCNHRDWMNPQGIGFNSTTDFHPVICVGAMDEYIESTFKERKAFYSNNGPGIDVWAPADETLAAGVNGVSGYTDYERYDDNRFYDTQFNGTSAAAPVVTGLVALYLQSNPTATSNDVKKWLKTRGSVGVTTALYADPYQDDTTTQYWTEIYNMRGAEKRILFDPTANDVKPKIVGVNISGVYFNQT